MNTEKIQNKIDSISADRDALERTRNKLTGDIALLLQQIAESEKPKSRHGDYGIETCGEDTFLRLITNPASVTGLTVSNEYGEISPGNKITTVFGNIFDLLKEWSKPFENFYKYGVRIEKSNSDKDIYLDSGGSHLALPEAEEVWLELGKAIFDLKRKQAK